MKNVLIIAILIIGLTAFFGFTGAMQTAATPKNAYATYNAQAADTIPAKKDTSKWRSKKTPYDSFGKPKTMDSIQIK